MSKIIKLDEHLSNMIAAGEVVEKISSVVKELVENSLDAKANSIEIELTNAGMKEIIVKDNGLGMDKEDIKLAFLRHATSKIKTQYDLYHINTLGFRGEAIPSIASVSDMIIKSNSGLEGYYVHSKAGKILDEGLTPLNQGTIIIVSNLFYNTPARLKYLKSENIELAYICDVVDKLAIANANVRFKLTNNKKVLLQTNGFNDMKNVLGNIYGLNVVKELKEISKEKQGIKMKGYIASFNINKARKTAITLIVNRRSVRNSNIINAVVEGYRTFLPIGRYPLAVIFLDIDPMLIDVNVHPTKNEIKFADEDIIKEMISKTIYQALSAQEKPFENVILQEEKTPYNAIIPEEKEDNSKYEEISLFEEEEKRLPVFAYIGQYAGTYLLFQNNEGLFLMDQHAAAERIRYEHYYQALGNPINSHQDLLIPIVMEFTQKEMIFAFENKSIFSSLGIEIEEAGEKEIYIRSVPLWMMDDIDIVEEIISYLIANRVVDLKAIKDELAKTISCKGAIKANHFINEMEVEELLAKLRLCENPFTCPHGRPTIVKLTQYEIEKMFKRVL